MSNANQVVVDTAIATAQALAPALIAAAVGSNPSVVALTPVITQFIQTAMQLHNAGAMTQEQLAQVFMMTSTGIRTTHDRWMELNAKDGIA